MEYRKTKELVYVMRLLGHKNIKNTLIYTAGNIPKRRLHLQGSSCIKEAAELIEAGYEYVSEMDHQKLFRKRK